jgi:27-O-demethylrifamycin SV methyltransferase
VNPRQNSIPDTPAVPDPSSVGILYDHRLFDLMAQMGDGNLHFGYWPSKDDQLSLADAMEEMTAQLIRRLQPRPGDRILDVGCGNGTPALRLAQAHDVYVVGISVSQHQVDRASERAREAGLAGRVRFELANALDLPFETGSFDGAWAIESMFHMPDKPRVLAGIARVLRPGGRFPIADLVSRRPAVQAGGAGPETYASRYASLTELTDYPALLTAAGLTPVEVTDITAETSRSGPEYAAWMRSQRDKYVEMFGTQGYSILLANHEAMSLMPELGYVMITAQRPT